MTAFLPDWDPTASADGGQAIRPPWGWNGRRCHRRVPAAPEAPRGGPMAGRRFRVAEVVEALRLWHARHSARRPARSMDMGMPGFEP